MVYQVGRPAILDGKRFLPETGTPIWKIDRSSTRLAVWLPEPLTVATWILKSLTRVCDETAAGAASRSEEAMEICLERVTGAVTRPACRVPNRGIIARANPRPMVGRRGPQRIRWWSRN